MKQELIKPIIKMGNSACVLLPKKWINGKARIELIEKPLNIKKDILEILDSYLEDILGIYLVGSYAREEETIESDIDVLVITNKINKKINNGKYEMILISKENLEKTLKKNILPLLPMLREAKPIFNSNLIKNYKNTLINKTNLKWHIETTKSALKINKEFIKLAEETNENISDGILYSLILRLREIYIIQNLKKNKITFNKDFKKFIFSITGSLKSYEAYLRGKKGENKELIKPLIAKKILNYIEKNL